MTAGTQAPLLHVSFGKQTAALPLPHGATLGQLRAALTAAFGVAPHTIKLLLPAPARGMVQLGTGGEQLAEEAGIHSGMRLKMMASRADAVAAVQAAEQQGDGRTPGFDHELRRELRRAGLGDGSSSSSVLPQGPYTFLRFEAWQRPGLRPPPSEALKLLHRLAADPGIAGVMNKHKWSVGLLSEMPPEGKVGVSPVCILGVNINKGQEICMRLRTDDLRGFRRYDRIRETLLHELAHQVWGEHDDNFKELNSQLRRECNAFDWRGAAARSVAGPAFEGSVHYDLPPERQTAMQQTAASSGQTLRQLAGGAAGETQLPNDARQAAAQAALRRSGGSAAGPGPSGNLPPPPQPFAKGDKVLYRHRDGTLEDAKVVAVDVSVQPPSYGIEVGGSYRETEASRLSPMPAQQAQQAEEVEGLGHRNAATEAKEAAVAALER